MSNLNHQEIENLTQNVNSAIQIAPTTWALRSIVASKLPIEPKNDLSSVIERMPIHLISPTKPDREILLAAEHTTKALLALSILQINDGKPPQTRGELTRSLKSLTVACLTQPGPSKIQNAMAIYDAAHTLSGEQEILSAEHLFDTLLNRRAEKSLGVRKYNLIENAVIIGSSVVSFSVPLLTTIIAETASNPVTNWAPFLFLLLTGPQLIKNVESNARQASVQQNIDILRKISTNMPSVTINALAHVL